MRRAFAKMSHLQNENHREKKGLSLISKVLLLEQIFNHFKGAVSLYDMLCFNSPRSILLLLLVGKDGSESEGCRD